MIELIFRLVELGLWRLIITAGPLVFGPFVVTAVVVVVVVVDVVVVFLPN